MHAHAWLNEQMVYLLGSVKGKRLIEEAKQHGTKRYEWLIQQLEEEGYTDIRAEFKKRLSQDALELKIRQKQNHILAYQQYLDQCVNDRDRAYFRKQIAKAEKYISDRQAGH